MENSLEPTAIEILGSRLKYAKKLVGGLDRSIASLDSLYHTLEHEWRERFKLNWELYRFHTPLLIKENRLEIEELQAILGIFVEWEEYEWCMVTNGVLQYMVEKYHEGNFRDMF